MGSTLIVDDLELAPVLSGAHLPTPSEGWISGWMEFAYYCEDIGRSVGMTSTRYRTRVTRMVAQFLPTILRT